MNFVPCLKLALNSLFCPESVRGRSSLKLEHGKCREKRDQFWKLIKLIFYRKERGHATPFGSHGAFYLVCRL